LLDHLHGQIPGGCFAEFGIQAFVAAATHVAYVQEKNHRVYMLDELRERGIQRSLREWTHTTLQQVDALYCSFDMDAVASAFAPGVSAPATDGFTVEEILACMHHLALLQQSRLMDIVEANPLHDVDKRTMRLAARMIATYIWQKARMRDAVRTVG
jgi:formiminoglutamase